MDEPKKILVVDDEEVARVTLKALLTKDGYEVTSVGNGNDAIEKIRHEHYDIVLLDLVMPGMDGMETLTEIKRINPEALVIMITGFGTIENAVNAMKKGAVDYVTKPFKKGEIQSALKRVLEEARFKKGSKNGEDGFEIFRDLVTQGAPGLCITKQDIDTIKEKHDLKGALVIQLTQLEELSRYIEDFLQKNDGAVILIDGLESLINEEPLENMEKFISQLNERLSLSNSRGIVSYDPLEIDEKIFRDFVRLISSPYTDLMSEVLSNSLRRKIIRFLHNTSSIFTHIQKELDVKDPPKLSFHLRNLRSAGIIEQDDDKRYSLTERGEKIYGLLVKLDDEGIKDMENVLWLRSG